MNTTKDLKPSRTTVRFVEITFFEAGQPVETRKLAAGRCQVCGCTDEDCRGCIERTGKPCSWAGWFETLCTACVKEKGVKG